MDQEETFTLVSKNDNCKNPPYCGCFLGLEYMSDGFSNAFLHNDSEKRCPYEVTFAIYLYWLCYKTTIRRGHQLLLALTESAW